MKISFITIGLLLSSFVCLLGQTGEADKTYEALTKLLEAPNGLTVKFEIEVSYPGQDQQLMNGVLYQQGARAYLDMPEVRIVSDGKSTWTYLKTERLIQITDAVPGSGIAMSPSGLLQLIEEEGFEYEITGNEQFEGLMVDNLEFKPTDRNSAYAKARIRLNSESGEPVFMELFEKNGGRYSLRINELSKGSIDASRFKFKKSDFPDADIEDLRI